MNKKLMTLAVAGALAAPAGALAQVTVYGRANLGVDRYEAKGSTAGTASDLAARNRVFDSGSRIGVRGVEDLGGGLRAVFSIESGVNVDNGSNLGQNGAANTSTGFLGSRDSSAGLESSFGRVTFGRQSVLWTNGTIMQSGANYVNIDVPMATVGGGFGRVTGFGTRINNTLMYTFPTMSGFGGYLAYAPNSEAVQGNGTGNVDATIKAARVTWEGVVKVQADLGINQVATPIAPATLRAKNTSTKLLVGWPYMPGAQISVLLGNIKIADTAAVAGFTSAGDAVKQRAIVVNWEQTFGTFQALAMAGKLNKVSGCGVAANCDNTEATSLMVGGRYILSKRTAAYVTYNATKNKDNQVLDYTAAGYTSANTLPAGADPKIIAVGVQHNF